MLRFSLLPFPSLLCLILSAVCLIYSAFGQASNPASKSPFASIEASRFQDGHPPRDAFDADVTTKWAARGRGSSIQFELAKPRELFEVGIGFEHPERSYTFDIHLSSDGKQWDRPFGKKYTSDGKAGTITYQFPKTPARFLRVTVYGSNANEWANIHTIHVPGVSPHPVPQPGPLASAKPGSGTGKAPSGASVAPGKYVVTEWASDSAVNNGVAISLDDLGRAYVTSVQRRKQSSLDIRNHQGLVKKDLSLTTVEERRAWYKEHLTGQRWLPDRNQDGVRDWKDLTVQKDAVVRAADSNGDGKADEFKTLDEYHTEVTGIAAGVLAVGSDVFVAAEPDFFRYVDKDGDGFPEERQLVATGFQVHMGQGGHNLSGVAVGPDGRIYWSLGDKGHYVETKEGTVYHMPNSGAVFRCELDGSKVERFSSGERNAQELAFDAHGNLFSMDNDGDYPGEKERALYITEGGEHGWRLNWQWLRKQDFIKISGLPAYNPWMDERLFLPDRPDLAAYLTPTIGNFGPGPCGFAANPGTALSDELANCFFMTNQQGQVRVFEFLPKGASFTFKERSAIKGGRSNTGLAVGPDGALYAASYGGSRGSIFRFDVAEGDRHPARPETQRILAKPSTELSLVELVKLLDHPDQRVRMKGQFELVRREAFQKLNFAMFGGATTTLGQMHALWGMGQLSRKKPSMAIFLQGMLQNRPPELLAQGAKVAGELPPDHLLKDVFRPKLRNLLLHESDRVKFFAAIALGKQKDPEAAKPLVDLLATGGARDPYLRHACVMGLKGAMTPGQLAGLSKHENRTVRLGAIVALRKLSAPEVRAFLEDEDELVLLEAARAIHDDQSIPEALPDLAGLLTRPGLTNEALMRRVINAAFRNGNALDLKNLVDYLQREQGTSSSIPKLRRTALASLLWWTEPPVLDAVEGRYRKHGPRKKHAEFVNAAVKTLQPVILADPGLLEVLLNGVNVRGEPAWLVAATNDQFAQWPVQLQTRMLDALARTKSSDLKSMVEAGLKSPHGEVREKARSLARQAGIPTVDLLLAVLASDQPGAGQGKAVLELAKLAKKEPAARAKLDPLIAGYRAGNADKHWKLELWQAAKAIGVELPETSECLEFGGDRKRGENLVMNHAAAQCIRCHQVGKAKPPGAGADLALGSIGPDLTGIGKRLSRAQLVSSLLEPSKEIADGFGTIVLNTKRGEEIAGILSRKTEKEWIVTTADGKTRQIDPANVQSHTLVSVMPPMGAILKPEEIRDVVEYLAK